MPNRERIVRALEDARGLVTAGRRLAAERRSLGQDLIADFAEMDAQQAQDEVVRLTDTLKTLGSEKLP